MGGVGHTVRAGGGERAQGASSSPTDALLSRDEVGAMFDSVAPRYDLLNRVLSLGIDRRWRRETIRALGLRPGDLLADICGGTGDLALEAGRQVSGVRTVNIDLSLPMLSRYRTRARNAGAEARAIAADAMRLPVATGMVQAAVIGFGIRNIADRSAALAEAHRALAPGGRLAVLEFALPSSPILRRPYLFYLRHLMPRIAALLSPSPGAYRYLGDSILAFPKPDAFAGLLESAGFVNVTWQPLSFGIAIRYLAIK